MPLLIPPQFYNVPEALASTTIFKKCRVKTSLGRQECYILITHLELHYQTSENSYGLKYRHDNDSERGLVEW